MKRIAMFLVALTTVCGAQTAQERLLQKAWPDIQRLYFRAVPSFVRGGGWEYQMIFDRDGRLLYGEEINQNRHTATTVPATILPRLGFIVHTHTMENFPWPSSGDMDTARKFGVPDYVLSCDELYVALPDRTVRRVGKIHRKGRLVFLE